MSTKQNDIFENIAQSVANNDILLKDLESSSFIVDKKENIGKYEIRAIYNFYTKSIIRRVKSSN